MYWVNLYFMMKFWAFVSVLVIIALVIIILVVNMWIKAYQERKRLKAWKREYND